MQKEAISIACWSPRLTLQDSGSPIMFLSAGEIVCTGRLLVADEECFIGAISPNDYLPYGSRGQRCTWRIQVRRLPGRAFKRIVSRRRFEEQATSDQRHAWSLGNASPLLCVLVTIAALVVGYLSTCARSRRGSRYHLFFSLWPRRSGRLDSGEAQLSSEGLSH